MDTVNNYLSTKDFEKTVLMDATGEVVFKSIINIPLWWTEMFEGSADQPGDTFTVRFGASVFKKMIVEEMMPGRKILWNVVDACVDIPELNNRSEWVGTKIIWEISPAGSGAELRLTHIGLTPEVECYSICQNGWNGFLQSLSAYIATGAGLPYKP